MKIEKVVRVGQLFIKNEELENIEKLLVTIKPIIVFKPKNERNSHFAGEGAD